MADINFNNMPHIHELLEQENPNFYKKTKKTGLVGNQNPFGGQVDPLILVYYLLMDASNISSNSSEIQAKQLGQNAAAQERLEQQAGHLQLQTVPALKTTVHHKWEAAWWSNKHWKKEEKKHKWDAPFWKKSYWDTRVTYKTHANANQVAAAQSYNEVTIQDRTTLSDKIQELQQTAQVGETQINTISDESMQSTQTGAAMLQILQALTFNALLRKPPQG